MQRDELFRQSIQIFPAMGNNEKGPMYSPRDPAGNITKQTTPLGEINFDYTYYRLTHKRYSHMDGNNVAYTYHLGGRIESITDGTGHRKLGYDALGNLVHEDRYIAIPNSDNVLAFHTEYTYDSWGRMRTLLYPDGEQVTYTYRWGGDLFSVHGTKGADSCRYIDSIAYNALGQRAYIHYGNGTMASYTYDALHRLIYLESSDSLGNTMQQIKYAFDPSSNITHIANNAPNIGPLGGRYENHYYYDPLHRLTRAGGADQYGFEQAFELSPAGRPLSMSTNGKVKHYAYGEHTPPHAPQRIMVEDGFRHTLHDLRWDPAGNLGQVSTLAHDRGDIQSRFLFWTEDSRLHTVVDDRHHSYYAYDHAGGSCGSRAQSQACLSYAEMQQRRRSQRTLKVTGYSHQLDVNADLMHTAAGLDEFTLYPSPYLVFTNRGYTKHYYAGTERLAARIGGGFDRAILREQTDLAMTATHLFKQSRHHTNERHLNAPPAHTIRRDHLPENIYMAMTREFEAPMHLEANVVIKSNDLISTAQNIVAGNAEPNVYFYHSDHLGSASWITEAGGKPVQHIQYLPYGEPFVNQRVSGYNERFTFTGKERDEETGYSYFGARYMEHEILTSFISVDRYASKYPFISPYAYCAWNPLRITDPNGDSIRLEGTADQRQKVLDYLHQYSHLTFQCDEKGYITLNTNLPGSEIKNHSDQYIADIIKDNINIVVIEIMETDNVASKGVRMQKDNPTLFGATSDYPKDGNWETGRVEGKQFLNINLLGSICGNDNESKTYPGRIIMHEFSEGFEGCKLARELQRPLTMSQKDYFWSHSRANNHVWGEFTSPGENGKIKLRSEYIGK